MDQAETTGNTAGITRAHSDAPSLAESWDSGNQEWWDWYVGLAENKSPKPDDPITLPPLPAASAPNAPDLAHILSDPYPLTQDHVDFFQRSGYIKLKEVFPDEAILYLRQELLHLLSQSAGAALDGSVEDRFLSLDMVWLENDLVRRFVLSPRIGKLAADLLGVPSVRLYHDNVLSKEPGCGRTPWHYDDHHFPIASNDVITVWIPVQPVPRQMGPLAFAKNMETYRLVESVPFADTGTAYDQEVSKVFRLHDVTVDDGPFDLGEVSFHHNVNFHTAGPNNTNRSRIVLSNTFFADGARLVENPTMISGDWRKFAPGVDLGGVLNSPVNPVCWPAAASEGDSL